jgi:hypothetical protein
MRKLTGSHQRGAAGLAAAAGLALTTLLPASAAQAATECPTSPWNLLSVAHEIIDTGTVVKDPKAPLATYKGAGDNPIPDGVWNAGYEPPKPYTANTTRNLQFNESQFIAAPGEPICSTAYITTSDGYTWTAMSMAVNAMWPYDSSAYTGLPGRSAFYAGSLVETPPPGVVKVTANFKAQNMRFWANENGDAPGTPGAVPLTRYFVKDEWGNEYVMHASGKDTPEEVAQAFEAAFLPPGWTKETRTLEEDLVLRPAEGSDGSFHHLVFRDSADNTYHQMGWSDRGSLQGQVGDGMPIWGGQHDNVLRGTSGADVIHGAGGDDTLRPGRGRDEVWGDAGRDTVVLPGKAADYHVHSANKDRTEVVLASRRHGRKTLRHVENVRIGGRTLKVAKLAPDRPL